MLSVFFCFESNDLNQDFNIVLSLLKNVLVVNSKLCLKLCRLIVTWNKNHSSKQVVSGERFFAAATFEGLSVALIWTG